MLHIRLQLGMESIPGLFQLQEWSLSFITSIAHAWLIFKYDRTAEFKGSKVMDFPRLTEGCHLTKRLPHHLQRHQNEPLKLISFVYDMFSSCVSAIFTPTID